MSLAPEEGAKNLKAALALLEPFPPHWQPYTSVLHSAFLNALACQLWPLALRYALVACFNIEPIHYPLHWHPIRVVRKWVLLRLILQIAALAQTRDKSVKVLERFEVDWKIVTKRLWVEVDGGVELSHGRESGFAREVRVFGEESGIAGRVLDKAELERQWLKLRAIADSSDH